MIKAPAKIQFYSWTELATRALALADTGQFLGWQAIAAVIEDEHPGATIRLRAAKRFQVDIAARCAAAQSQDLALAS